MLYFGVMFFAPLLLLVGVNMNLIEKLQNLSDKYQDPDLDSIIVEVLGELARIEELELRLSESENLLGFYRS